MHADSIPTIASLYRFQWEEAQNSYVLLYPEGMVKLNPSAGAILKQCDGIQSIGAIIMALQQQYPDVDLEGDVREFLEVAYGNGWIYTKD